MPQIMAEAFARGLLDKIMIQVLDVIDRDANDGKSWEQNVNEETGDTQSEFLHDRSRTRERTHVNYNKVEEIELIAKIVRDLRDIQIGDSPYVLPPSLLALERQVKYAACNIDDVSFVKTVAGDAETQLTTQGQGDTHQITHAATVESSTQPAETTRMKVKGEAANVTISLLQQLIEQLETKTFSASSENVAPSNATSKERITLSEEKEEQFIGTIEGSVENAREIGRTSQGSDSIDRFRIVKLKKPDEELRSYSSQHVATSSTSKEVGLQELQIEKRGSNSLSSLKALRDDVVISMEQILPIEDAEKRKTLGETANKRKKKSFGGRLRKLLRAAFGRQKN